MHYAEIQDGKQNVLWHGRIQNSRDGFDGLLEKLKTIERSNSDTIKGIFMNPTGNYHVPVKYFLEQNGFDGLIYMIDARRTVHLRTIMNLGTEKSDLEDAHVLASTPWFDQKYAERPGHERSPLSEITRNRDDKKKCHKDHEPHTRRSCLYIPGIRRSRGNRFHDGHCTAGGVCNTREYGSCQSR